VSDDIEGIAPLVPCATGFHRSLAQAPYLVDRLIEPGLEAIAEALALLGQIEIADGETDSGTDCHGGEGADSR
jgi:hypothetical protein